MMPFRLPKARGDQFRRRINRAPSPLLARGVPWLTIMAGSLLPSWLSIASAPILPPFGYLLLLAWRQLRPGLLPIWAGLPLGLFDDLFSGQPFGSAVLIWSLTMILFEAIEARFPWRNFLVEWAMATGFVAAYAFCATVIANLAGGAAPIVVTAPQIAIGALVYPLVGRFVAASDRFRLLPFMAAGQ